MSWSQDLDEKWNKLYMGYHFFTYLVEGILEPDTSDKRVSLVPQLNGTLRNLRRPLSKAVWLKNFSLQVIYMFQVF